MMKFSEAIRLGSMLRPLQAIYTLFDPDDGSSCALGAAAEAIGILDTSRYNCYLDGSRAPREWRPLLRARAECPACGVEIGDVQDCVKHLNNLHIWKRERIADWIEALEQRSELPQSDGAVVPVLANSVN